MRATHKFLAAFLVSSATLGMLAADASASGFAVARFGGGHGNPVSVSPVSIYYNPGAMAFTEGTNIYLDYTGAWRTLSYDRTISDDPAEWSTFSPDLIDQDIYRETNSGENSLSNFIGSPMIALMSDFGTDNFVGGLSFYAPFGGQAVWDETSLSADAQERAPFAADGPQRWFSIDGTIRVLTLSLGFGVQTDDERFGLGITTNLNITQVDTIRARNGNGSADVINEDGRIIEGRSRVDVDGIDPSIGIGIMYEAIKNRLILAASWQSAPNVTGNQELDGTLTNNLSGGEPGGGIPEAETDIIFVQQMPHTFRWGIGYRFLEDPTNEDSDARAEIRLTGDFITWNDFKHQCLVDSAGVNGSNLEAREQCDFNEDGSRDISNANVIQNIIRRWNLGWGVKLGGSYYIRDNLEVNASVSFDSNAVPDETLDPVLVDMPKMVLDVGTVIGVTDWLDISVLIANVFYFERELTDSGLFSFDTPSKQPDANGTYNQNVLLGNLGLRFHF